MAGNPDVDRLKAGAGRLKKAQSGALVTTSALCALAAAAAWREICGRRVLRADLAGEPVRVERLCDLRFDRQALAAVERGLRAEWGNFALLGFATVREMAASAGATTFVARRREGNGFVVTGALQALLLDVHGDPRLLRAAYPTFQALTGRDVWRRSRRRGGDTVVLLQITVFDRAERGSGLGSLLRNVALNILSGDVRDALTMTPVEASARLNLADATTYAPAMRFHARGGAEATLLLPGYKAGAHRGDVVVMRYRRDATGEWPVSKPAMRVRAGGPIQAGLARTVRRLAALRPQRRRGGARPAHGPRQVPDVQDRRERV